LPFTQGESRLGGNGLLCFPQFGRNDA
jgi:hypothetical protein